MEASRRFVSTLIPCGVASIICGLTSLCSLKTCADGNFSAGRVISILCRCRINDTGKSSFVLFGCPALWCWTSVTFKPGTRMANTSDWWLIKGFSVHVSHYECFPHWQWQWQEKYKICSLIFRILFPLRENFRVGKPYCISFILSYL
jgi:hypothetical protein